MIISATTDPMLPPIVDHHDSGDLNELLRIERDARDHEHGGGASHYYELVLDVAPPEEAWVNTDGECACRSENCLQAAGFQATGAWVRCLACGAVWDATGSAYKPAVVGTLQFQHGPRTEPDSTPGLLDGALIAVLLDRYRGFQSGPYSCAANEHVIRHLTEALHWVQERVRKRQQQGVLGQNRTHEEPK